MHFSSLHRQPLLFLLVFTTLSLVYFNCFEILTQFARIFICDILIFIFVDGSKRTTRQYKCDFCENKWSDCDAALMLGQYVL